MMEVDVYGFIGEHFTVPWFTTLWYLFLSATTFFVYLIDKQRARNKEWRVSEDTLHLLAVLGGWPGALLAQQIVRHKTRKQPFQTRFRITVGVNLAVFVSVIVYRLTN